MKILAAGDLHLRRSSPSLRSDDFLAAQERKLDEILGTAIEQDCQYVVFPGDVFDRSDAPHGLVEWAIRKFQSCSLDYLFVYGQHDLRYHTSDKQNTPLGVLSAALFPRAHILTPNSVYRAKERHLQANFYGCSWGEPLPEHMTDDFNIMVMHRPISDKPIPWDHPDFLLASELVKKVPAQVFITGDNHAQFICKFKNAIVFNMGSVMRTNTLQVDSKPAVAIISLEANKPVEFVISPLTIQKDVFYMDKVEAKQVEEEKIAKFVSGLQDGFNPELKFVDNLRVAAKTAPQGVRDIINQVLC